MKKVRYLAGVGEPVGPGILPGEEREVADDLAERLIQGGIAEEIRSTAASKKAKTAPTAASKAKTAPTAASKKAAGAEKR